jgi:hypothetical protein
MTLSDDFRTVPRVLRTILGLVHCLILLPCGYSLIYPVVLYVDSLSNDRLFTDLEPTQVALARFT